MIYRCFSLLFIFCLLQLNGCAWQAPSSRLLLPEEEIAARQVLADFFARKCNHGADADISLLYQRLTRNLSFSAMLQVNHDGRLRFTIVDPLDRSLFLFVVNGNAFTVTDNRRSLAYTGQVGSRSWQEYIPVSMHAQDIFYWLSGRLRPEGMRIVAIREELDGESYWYELEFDDGLIHQVLLDLEALTLRSHLVLNDRRKVVLAVTYGLYQEKGTGCPWPMEMEISGPDMSGSLQLTTNRLYPSQDLPEKTFHLNVPPHFSVELLP